MDHSPLLQNITLIMFKMPQWFFSSVAALTTVMIIITRSRPHAKSRVVFEGTNAIKVVLLCLEVFALCSASYVDRNMVSEVWGSLRSFKVSILFVYSLRLSRHFTDWFLYIASTWQLSALQQRFLLQSIFLIVCIKGKIGNRFIVKGSFMS